MRFTKLCLSVFFTFAIIAVGQTSAQDGMMKDDKTMGDKMKDDRPIVATIRADWCPYCKTVEPVVAGLKMDHAKNFKFVVFDVTNAETTAESAKRAETLGLTKFFNEYRKKTSSVAIIKDGKILYKTSNNSRRDAYEKALAAALQ